MRATEQTPDPIVVEIVSDGTQWWEIISALGPFAVLVAALIAAYFAHKNLKHRRESEQRSEWWTRAQWALDAAISDDELRQMQGFALLGHLADSDLAGKEESEILETAWEAILGESPVDDESDVRDNESIDGAKEVPYEHNEHAQSEDR